MTPPRGHPPYLASCGALITKAALKVTMRAFLGGRQGDLGSAGAE